MASENPVRAAASTDLSQWAMVTGASAGIGEAFCRQLAAEGYHLVLVARRADRLHTLASELREAFGTASLVLPADLSDPRAPKDIARRLEQDEITLEFLVNNAGYGLPGRFTEADWPDHRDFIQVMVTAVCELTWRLLPAMQACRQGYVINVASVAGLLPGSEGHTLYGASKSFLVRFSESLALENRTHGIKVIALCPGFTYSEFHDVTGTRELANRLPAYMWQSAEQVVRFGLRAVRRREPAVIAIPSRFYRLLVRLTRHLPGLARWLIRRNSRRFRKLE